MQCTPNEAWVNPPADSRAEEQLKSKLNFLLKNREAAVNIAYESWYNYRNPSESLYEPPPPPNKTCADNPAPYEQGLSFDEFNQQDKDKEQAKEFIETVQDTAPIEPKKLPEKVPLKKPIVTIKKDKMYRPPEEKKLIQEAQNRIKKFDAGGEDNQHSFAEWEANVEISRGQKKMSEQKLKEVLENFKELIRPYKGIETDTEEILAQKRKSLTEFLNKKYYWNYARDSASFLGQINGEGGNCESQTLLLAIAFSEANLIPKGRKKLTVQKYKKHVQLIEYDTVDKRPIIS